MTMPHRARGLAVSCLIAPLLLSGCALFNSPDQGNSSSSEPAYVDTGTPNDDTDDADDADGGQVSLPAADTSMQDVCVDPTTGIRVPDEDCTRHLHAHHTAELFFWLWFSGALRGPSIGQQVMHNHYYATATRVRPAASVRVYQVPRTGSTSSPSYSTYQTKLAQARKAQQVRQAASRARQAARRAQQAAARKAATRSGGGSTGRSGGGRHR